MRKNKRKPGVVSLMPAERMSNVPESGTVKISNIVSKLKQQGISVISFSMGEPDFATPNNIKEACADALRKNFTHYTPSAGIPELRKAVAKRTVEFNHIPCDESNVIITPTKQAIFMTMLAMINEGDEVILPDPTWGTYDACIRLVGGIPKYVKLDQEKDFRMLPRDVAEAVSPRTKMILINSPANPTGSVLERGDVEGIAAVAKQHDLWVLSEEVYEPIIFEGEPLSIASMEAMFDRTITVNGFSKTYAMTGWRIGWAVAPKGVIKLLNTLQTHSLTCVTSFVQKAGYEALTGQQESVKEMADEFKARRDLIMRLLEEIPTLHCPAPKGAFYIFPSFDQKMSSDDLAAFLLEQAHVAVTPGSAFGPSGEGHIRISYAASREDIIEGMARIKEALAKL